MSESYLLLNVNDGTDMVHDPEHLSESCNTDDVVGKKRVDLATAASLIDSGQAVRCKHCTPEEIPA